MWLSTLAQEACASILRFVRPTFTRIIIATATLVAGILIGSLHRNAQQRPTTQANSPDVSVKLSKVRLEAEEVYPEDLRAAPLDIFYFVKQHPQANLQRLWQRLGITSSDPIAQFSSGPCDCEVNSFDYNLDDDVEIETVLQFKQSGAYRYLIFKGPEIQPKFLGHIDVYAKYTPADPVVFLSNGRAFLVVQQTAGTGTGLAAWADTVYQVSNAGVKPVVSYLAQVTENRDFGMPIKEFLATPVSCEIKEGQAILTLSYRVEYKAWYNDPALFAKQQKVVLRGSLKDGSVVLDVARSEVVPEEFETIYNFDTMSQREFLKYNHSELRAIATGNNSEKKTWLKEFLATCRTSSIKRELSRFLN